MIRRKSREGGGRRGRRKSRWRERGKSWSGENKR